MGTLDRDAAREVLVHSEGTYVEDQLDALERCVRLAPQQTIDRDNRLLIDTLRARSAHTRGRASAFGRDQDAAQMLVSAADLDRVLALLRPVDGVTLTRDEVALVVYSLLHIRGDWQTEAMRDLAKRLEAVS